MGQVHVHFYLDRDEGLEGGEGKGLPFDVAGEPVA
jgi:hypothetical protein